MKWLEVIHLRTSQEGAERAVQKLPEHCDIFRETKNLEAIEIYQPTEIQTDIVTTLTWTGNTLPGKTREGLLMAEYQEYFGMVDHKLLYRLFPISDSHRTQPAKGDYDAVSN